MNWVIFYLPYSSWGFGLTQVIPYRWMLYLSFGRRQVQLKFRRRNP